MPLSTDALAIIEDLPHWNEGDFMFSTRGGRIPVDDWSQAKAQLDALMSEELGHKVTPFVTHDIRRTVRTRLSSITTPEIAELVIGHAKKGMAKIYDQPHMRPRCAMRWSGGRKTAQHRHAATGQRRRPRRGSEGAGMKRQKGGKRPGRDGITAPGIGSGLLTAMPNSSPSSSKAVRQSEKLVLALSPWCMASAHTKAVPQRQRGCP